MSTKKVKQKPILYISQPTLQFPDVTMQNRYFTRDDVPDTLEEEQPLLTAKDTDTNTQAALEATTEETKIERENEVDYSSNPFDTKRKKQYTFQRVKYFKDMTIDEKLHYLEKFPEQLPPVTCLYLTEGKTYTGTLLNNEEAAVEIQLHKGEKVTLMKSAIQEIRMLGFH